MLPRSSDERAVYSSDTYSSFLGKPTGIMLYTALLLRPSSKRMLADTLILAVFPLRGFYVLSIRLLLKLRFGDATFVTAKKTESTLRRLVFVAISFSNDARRVSSGIDYSRCRICLEPKILLAVLLVVEDVEFEKNLSENLV